MSVILLAEDDAGITQLLQRLLRRADFEVIAAGDGATALEAARSRRPDLVVTDLDMPVLDGWGCAAHCATIRCRVTSP
ncbi:response regulator [Actinoplanes sichuanensis]|uniref:Response regulator n=1 Tax=Actinoplanes sichuanensis TaxID=512349 RepID=A0ABW4A3M5_9ACTN|nr:response regulator [Actinoplanes sichuanensis]